MLAILHDKQEIASYLSQNVYLHLYSIGDLDDFFWPYTVWYAWQEEEIQAIILLYAGPGLPVVLALNEPTAPMKDLLEAVSTLLPVQFYAHLSPGLEELLAKRYRVHSHGQHYKMAFHDRSRIGAFDLSQTFRLTSNDLPAITRLYEDSYPGNWFDARMLQTGQYYGIEQGGELVSIAGIHVYSERYRVAALGNIVTHPAFRGQGLGKTVTARLCAELLDKVDHIGLNVKTDNYPAIAAYQALGFVTVASYGEFTIQSM